MKIEDNPKYILSVPEENTPVDDQQETPLKTPKKLSKKIKVSEIRPGNFLQYLKGTSKQERIILVLFALLFVYAVYFISDSIYNQPLRIEKRAIKAVDALFIEDGNNIAPEVVGHSGAIADATKKVNKIINQDLRIQQGERIGIAKKMSDVIGNINSLHKEENGTKILIKDISDFQINNLQTNLEALDNAGKTVFTAAYRPLYDKALLQFTAKNDITHALDAMYKDGVFKKDIKDSADSGIFEELEARLVEIENPELRKELADRITTTKEAVIANEERLYAIWQKEQERIKEEEAKKAEEEKKKAEEAGQTPPPATTPSN